MMSNLSKLLGVSVAELSAILIILCGLLGGVVVNNLSDDNSLATDRNFEPVLDSIISAYEMDMTGSSTDDKPRAPVPPEEVQAKAPEIININSASKTALMDLPGIGSKTALIIIEYRKSNKFSCPEDIMNVKGIGPGKYAKMKDRIKVD